MADKDKVYKPEEISENPLPGQDVSSSSNSGKVDSETYKPEEISEQSFPAREISKGVRNPFFSTAARIFWGIFKISRKGGIQVGEVKENVSGKVTFDINGFHAFNSSDQELIRVNEGGFHGYDTKGQELIEVDAGGLHGYDAKSRELIRVDNKGFHGYDTSEEELIKVDNEGFHGYLTGGNKAIKISGVGIEGYGSTGNTFNFYDEEGGTKYGQMGYIADGNSFYFLGTSGASLWFYAGAGGVLMNTVGEGDISMGALGTGEVSFTTASGDIHLAPSGNLKINLIPAATSPALLIVEDWLTGDIHTLDFTKGICTTHSVA